MSAKKPDSTIICSKPKNSYYSCFYHAVSSHNIQNVTKMYNNILADINHDTTQETTLLLHPV